MTRATILVLSFIMACTIVTNALRASIDSAFLLLAGCLVGVVICVLAAFEWACGPNKSP